MPRPKGCTCGVRSTPCPIHPDRVKAGAEMGGTEPNSGRSAGAEPASGASATSARPASGKRRRDPPPRPAGRPTSGSSGGKRRRQYEKPTDEQLEDGLRKALKVCSAGMRFKCDYCATHMERQAAATARRMIEDQDLRDVAEKIYVWCDQYAGASHLFMFLAVPVIHHLAPGFVYRSAAPIVGVMSGAGPMPPRQRGHVHHMPPVPAAPAASAPAAPPEPPGGGAPPADPFAAAAAMFGDMDMEQLLAAAGAAGIDFNKLDLSALTSTDGAPHTLDETDASTPPTETADTPAIVPADDTEPDPFAAAAALAAEASVAVSDAD